MMASLMEAGRIARLNSSAISRTQTQTVEVLVTEDGVVVRGSYRCARTAFGASGECLWHEIDAHPPVLVECVRMTVRALEARAIKEGVTPFRAEGL